MKWVKIRWTTVLRRNNLKLPDMEFFGYMIFSHLLLIYQKWFSVVFTPTLTMTRIVKKLQLKGIMCDKCVGL